MAKRDLVGQVFGHLKVVAADKPYKYSNGRTSSSWLCECDICGVNKNYVYPALKNGAKCDCEKRLDVDLTGRVFWAFGSNKKG